MRIWTVQLDRLLRTGMSPSGDTRWSALWLVAQVLLFGLSYGAVMGTFGGVAGERLLQIGYSAVKVPLLLLVTFIVSLPSFFVLNTLFGVRGDFAAAVRSLLATQAVLTIILAALSPYTALWYRSSADYNSAIVFNGLMFAIATFTAQWLLRRIYRPLIARNPRHRWLLRTWSVLYAFVAIQLAWVLRPFVGDPHKTVQFFREDAWGNAYVVVAHMLWDLILR